MRPNKLKDLRPHIVVIGSGIVGATIAFRLASHDIDLTVVDSDLPGTAATGRSFAYINAFGKTPRSYHELSRASMDAWHRFDEDLKTDIGLRWHGRMSWVATEKDAQTLIEEVQLMQSWGYPSRTIDESEMRWLEPGLNPGPVKAAALNESEGDVDAPKVTREVIAWLQRRGVKISLETTVTGLRLGLHGDMASRVVAVQTNSGEILCDTVVLAAGLGSSSIASTVGLLIPQRNSPGVIVKTDRRPQVLANISVMYPPPIGKDQHHIHLRQMQDGTVIIGEDWRHSLSLDDSQEHADALLDGATRFLPGLSAARGVSVPVGYRPMPIDGLPVLGFPEEIPNLYIALMHSGVTLAPIVGELSVREIVGRERISLLDPYRFERFR